MPVMQSFTELRGKLRSLFRRERRKASRYATRHADLGDSAVRDLALKTHINDRDRAHLQAFSPKRKARVMAKIMALDPDGEEISHGKNDFEKTLMKIRHDGFRLIDIQSQETSFATVWYRKGFLGLGAGDAIMLLWEASDDAEKDEFGRPKESMTVLSWAL